MMNEKEFDELKRPIIFYEPFLTIDEQKRIATNGLSEQHNNTDKINYVKSVRKSLNEQLITQEKAYDMLQNMALKTQPQVEIKEVLKMWDDTTDEMKHKRIKELKSNAQDGLKANNFTYQQSELESIAHDLFELKKERFVTNEDSKDIFNRFVQNTKDLKLDIDEIETIEIENNLQGITMTKEQEIYNDDNRVLNEIFGNGNTNTEDEFKKITIDNKDDFDFVLKHGVTSSIYNNEREKMIHNVLEHIFEQMKAGKMSEGEGYMSFEVVANNSEEPILWASVKELWNTYADKYNIKTKA